MINKTLATLVQVAIELRLIKNYKLVSNETLEHLRSSLIAAEKEVGDLKDGNSMAEELLHNSASNTAHYKELSETANNRISQLTSELTKITSQRNEAVAEQVILSQQLSNVSSDMTEAQQQVEIANSETLVLQESLDEASTISKQLKEALERWMS